jgi:hypothetical protein
MLNTIAKRVQSRLSRAGVKVSLGEIKEQCEMIISDIENPKEEEILNVQMQFYNRSSNLSIQNLDNNIDDVSIQNLDNNIDDVSIQNLDDNIDDLFAPVSTQETNTLAPTTKSQLIATTSDQMGIALNAQEISQIAENISICSDDFEQDIDAIKSAIMAFINHKAMINQSKINELIHEVREVVSEKNQENSQLLSDGLRSINNDIQEANKAFKSNVSKALAAFDIPALKAS